MQYPHTPPKQNASDADTDIQRTTALIQANSVITAVVLDISHTYARGLGTADTPGKTANRAGPGREDPIATGKLASCPAKADNHVEAQVKALLTHATSTGIGDAPYHIDMRLASFPYHHHILTWQKADY